MERIEEMIENTMSMPLLDVPVMAMDDLQEEIIHRLGLEVLPARETRWLPLSCVQVPDETSVRVPKSLVQSIARFGVLQAPSVVGCTHTTEKEGQILYEVIAGRRRTLAARLAGMTTMRFEVYTSSTPQLSALLGLIENAQRSAAWIKEVADLRLLINEKVGMTMKELVACGFARQSLAERLKIAQLPSALLDQIVAGKVALEVARKLVRLTETQLTQVIQASQYEPLTAELVKQALKAQMSENLSSTLMSFPSWDAPSVSPTQERSLALETEGWPHEHSSLKQLLAALRSFTQSPDYDQVADVHMLIEALLQRLEAAEQETSLSAIAS
jgi:ParB/RepB/Spo0J family partition protein